jgi:hypothetical protein
MGKYLLKFSRTEFNLSEYFELINISARTNAFAENI